MVYVEVMCWIKALENPQKVHTWRCIRFVRASTATGTLSEASELGFESSAAFSSIFSLPSYTGVCHIPSPVTVSRQPMFISSSLTEGNGSEPVPGVPAELFRFPLPIPGLVAAAAAAALPASTLIPLCDDAVLLNFHRLPPSSLSLALLSFLCLSASRCAASFHPD